MEGVQTRRTLPKSIQIGNVRGTKRGTKIDLVEGGEAEGDGAPQSHYRSKPNQLDQTAKRDVRGSAKLSLDRYPHLETAHACSPVEFLAVIFEVRRIDSFVARLGKPFCPDRHGDVMHGRNVFAVRKYGVALGRNAQSRKFGGEVRESGHLYTGEIVEVTVIVHVVADAKRPPPFATASRKNLSRDVAEMGLQALP